MTRIHESQTSIRKGMQVCSSDGVLLGQVARLWEAADLDAAAPMETRDAIIYVTGGDMPLYVPRGAVATCADERLTLTETAERIATLPWRYRPQGLPRGRGRGGVDELPAILNNPQNASTRYM